MKFTQLMKSVSKLINFGHIFRTAFWILPVTIFEATVEYLGDTPANVLCCQGFEDPPTTSCDLQCIVHGSGKQ